MRILVLDNYDSFTYNLVYILRELHSDVEVFRNDKIALQAVNDYDKIVLSPGPGLPEESGIMQELIRTYAPTKSIFGVCLGHQGIAEVFGATLENMSDVLHGVSNKALITDPEEPLFQNIPGEIQVGRYHSWTVVPESVPAALKVTAVDEKGRIMGISHRSYDVRGVQFHPESVLTEYGRELMTNWIRL